MKKKTIFLASLSAFLCLGAVYISNNSAPVHTHAEGEKETIYFDIGKEVALNNNICVFAPSITLPDAITPIDFTWYVNNEAKTTGATKDGDNFYIAYNGSQPSAVTGDTSNYYTHYLVKAGTTLFTSSTANYVLEHDYNFWSTRGQNLGFSYIFQHGGADHFGSTNGLTNGNINTLKFSSFAGAIQPGLTRFLFQPKYEITSEDWTSNQGWNERCPIYIDKGEGFVLNNSSTKSPVIWANGINSDSATNGLLFLLQYNDIFGSTEAFENIEMSRSYYTFYIPSGTLWGGIDSPFMIEGDYYFEISKTAVKGSYINGFFDDIHDYVKHEAKAPTCTSEGNVEYYTCDRATHGGETEYFTKNADGSYTATTKEAVTLGCTAHDFVAVAEVPASSGQHGTAAHYKCSTCDKVFTSADKDSEVTLDSLILHDYIKHEAKAATCEEDGNVEYYSCSACDKYFLLEDGVYKETTLADITTSKTGHTYESHEVEVGTEKVTYYTCSVCNKYFLKDGENYTETTLDDINVLLADAWGKYFLSATTEPCSNSNADNKEALDAVWSTLETEFGKLSDDVKALVKKASAKASEGTKLEESVARYDHIVDRYGLKDFISRVTTDGSNYQNRVNANNTFIIVLISVLSVLALGSTVTLMLIKKRRTH